MQHPITPKRWPCPWCRTPTLGTPTEGGASSSLCPSCYEREMRAVRQRRQEEERETTRRRPLT